MIQSRRHAHRGRTAWAALAAAMLAGAAGAHPPAGPIHSPARARFAPPKTAQALAGSLGPRSAYVAPGPMVPRQAAVWTRPQAAPAALAAATLPSDWTALGPAPILNAGGTFGGALAAVSGRDTAIAADPTDPKIFYVGAAGGGVWKTSDGGHTYKSLSDAVFSDLAIGAIAVDPTNPKVIYVGTGEPNNNGDLKYGVGVYKTTDGGATWSLTTGPQSVFVLQAVSKIVVDPKNPKNVYLALGTAFQLPAPFGIYKSADGGATWALTTQSITTKEVYSDVVINPQNPNILYAAVGDLENLDEYAGTLVGLDGVYKTTDGGATWQAAGNFPRNANVGRISLALSPSSPDTVYASVQNTDASNGYAAFGDLYGVFKTVNGGTNWAQLPNVPDFLQQQGWYDDTLVVDPANANNVFGGGQVNYNEAFGDPNPYGKLTAVVGSVDGGVTWHDYSVGQGGRGPHTDVHAAAFLADGTLVWGTDGGVWRLNNPRNPSPTPPTDGTGAGSNILWDDVNGNLDTIQFTGIGLDPTNMGVAYGGAQDNGTSKLAGGVWNQVVGGDGGFTRVDQSRPQTVYQEFYGISLERSDDGGQTFNVKLNGVNQGDKAGDFLPYGYHYRSAFYVPFILDPMNQARVLYPTDHLYESLDRADDFSLIASPGVAGFNPFGQTINALGVNGPTIYAATNYDLAVTHDEGKTWANVSLPGQYGYYTHYQSFFVNPVNPLDVYAVVGVFTGSGEVFRSIDGGVTWHTISANLPDQPYNAIQVDPAASVIYVGGDDGVYVSDNKGVSWARYGGALPAVQVVDLSIAKTLGVLGAGTHGRGLWEIPLINRTVTEHIQSAATVTRGAGGLVVSLALSNTGGAYATYVTIPSSVTASGKTSSGQSFVVTLTPSSGAYPVGVGTIPSGAAATPQAFSFPAGTTPAPGSTLTVRYAVAADESAPSFSSFLVVPR